MGDHAVYLINRLEMGMGRARPREKSCGKRSTVVGIGKAAGECNKEFVKHVHWNTINRQQHRMIVVNMKKNAPTGIRRSVHDAETLFQDVTRQAHTVECRGMFVES